MLGKLAEASGGLFFMAFFLLVNFPGGTIFMALSCSARRLDGWDWVLSVIVPAYGLFKGLSSNACLDIF
jgi:hypothetical protein